jgi:hypothetical protein
METINVKIKQNWKAIKIVRQQPENLIYWTKN